MSDPATNEDLEKDLETMVSSLRDEIAGLAATLELAAAAGRKIVDADEAVRHVATAMLQPLRDLMTIVDRQGEHVPGPRLGATSARRTTKDRLQAGNVDLIVALARHVSARPDRAPALSEPGTTSRRG